MKKIFLIEDDLRLAELIQRYLEQQGFHVVVCHQGDQAQSQCLAFQPDIVVLDLMLPGLDGFAVCRLLRTWFSGPIMMLTAKQSDIDQVLGLELGADDYVIKPIEPRVLLARIQVLLRREQRHSKVKDNQHSHLIFGQLQINPAAREVFFAGNRVELTSYEFDLLYLLAQHAGQILGRELIHQQVIGREYDGLDRTVDVRVSHLRRKLGDNPELPHRIKTIWGKGYLFVADAWMHESV